MVMLPPHGSRRLKMVGNNGIVCMLLRTDFDHAAKSRQFIRRLSRVLPEDSADQAHQVVCGFRRITVIQPCLVSVAHKPQGATRPWHMLHRSQKRLAIAEDSSPSAKNVRCVQALTDCPSTALLS
jgi:hypothetical protein